ncbi:hypothetical protein GIB67_017478 [Kingdonia uniflora]|uniref:Uncharacterized protein n=1 Tax=Kingdonia uniflora TaxID=39325 RepID=A0A7J7M4F2_9MAGN|nr:hypothetical protein GIB67_017478 [Kingdonia uniflora]
MSGIVEDEKKTKWPAIKPKRNINITPLKSAHLFSLPESARVLNETIGRFSLNGKLGLSPLQKMTAPMMVLANIWDEDECGGRLLVQLAPSNWGILDAQFNTDEAKTDDRGGSSGLLRNSTGMAAECARNALLLRVMEEKFETDLMKIAMTTLSSKILSQDKELFATLAVDAVMRLKGSTNLESNQIIKNPGCFLKDSFLDEGKLALVKPKHIENAKILVANTAMDTDKVKIYGAHVHVDSMARIAQIEGGEKEKMKEKVQKIISLGINCFINRQLICNFPEELFADAGILAIKHADIDGIERFVL